MWAENNRQDSAQTAAEQNHVLEDLTQLFVLILSCMTAEAAIAPSKDPAGVMKSTTTSICILCSRYQPLRWHVGVPDRRRKLSGVAASPTPLNGSRCSLFVRDEVDVIEGFSWTQQTSCAISRCREVEVFQIAHTASARRCTVLGSECVVVCSNIAYSPSANMKSAVDNSLMYTAHLFRRRA